MDPRPNLPPELLAACFGLLLVAGAAQLARSYPSDDVVNPAGGGGSSAVESVPPPAQPRRSRPVFVCRHASTVEFADRPCGPAGENRIVEWAAASPAGAAPRTVPPAPGSSTRPRPATEQAPTGLALQVRRCHELRNRLEAIDDRMRQGYSARDAARLWNQWRAAKERLRQAGC
jgi:hypothetical protein